MTIQFELVDCVTEDGLRLHGAWQPATGEGPLKGLTVVTFHGVGGNFYSSYLFRMVTPKLLNAGASVLWTNSRGHDGLTNGSGPKGGQGAAVEIVDDCRLDVQAWTQWIHQHVAVSRTVLWGHSLGAIKSLYAMAYSGLSEVKGVIASSPPVLSAQRFEQGQRRDEYLENLAEAQEKLNEEKDWDLIRVRYPFPLWIAARSYVDKYGPGERYNFLRFAPQIQRPTLFTYGALELQRAPETFAGVEDSIRKLPGADPWFDFRSIPRANHFYTEGVETLGEEIIDWLEQLAQST